jgi:hypothetical protein
MPVSYPVHYSKCPICGKPRGRNTSHAKCSVVMQRMQREKAEMQKSKGKGGKVLLTTTEIQLAVAKKEKA